MTELPRRVASIVALVLVAACGEDRPGPYVFHWDASTRDASQDAAARDGSVDAGDGASSDAGDAADTGAADAGVDSGLMPGCTVDDSRTVVSPSVSTTFDPALVASGTDAVVAWVETRSTEPNVFERLIPSTGALASEQQLTADTYVESDLVLIPTGTDYLLGYTRTAGADVDVATFAFEPLAGTPLGTYDVTNDVQVDRHSAFIPSTTGGFIDFFERADATTSVVRVALFGNGAPNGAIQSVSSTRTITAPFVVDTTTGDYRLFRRSTSTSIESIRIDSAGAETSPDPHLQTISGTASIGDRFRTTEPNASPRAFLASATRSARATAYLQLLAADGSAVGSFTEVDTRTITSPTLVTHGGYALIAYRTTDVNGPEVRLRAYASDGTRVVDQSLVLTASATGVLEMVALSNGHLVMVLDDAGATNRELRALRISCPF